MTHAEAANAAMARLGMTLASPQKVIGPAAAAVNSSVAAQGRSHSDEQQRRNQRYLE